MSLHVFSNKSITKTISGLSPLAIEVNYSVAAESLTDCIREMDKLSQLIDNVEGIRSVCKKYNSSECLNVINSLVGDQLSGYSYEGFLGDAWEKIKKFFKMLWDKLVAFFKWIWEKLKSLFGGTRKVSCYSGSSLALIAKSNPKVADLIVIRGSSTQSLVSSESLEDGQSGLNIDTLAALTNAMRTNVMNEGVTIQVIKKDVVASLMKKVSAFENFINGNIANYISSVKNPDKLGNIVGTNIPEEFAERTSELLRGIRAYSEHKTMHASFEDHVFKSYTEVYEYCQYLNKCLNFCESSSDKASELFRALNKDLIVLEKNIPSDSVNKSMAIRAGRVINDAAQCLASITFAATKDLYGASRRLILAGAELFKVNKCVAENALDDGFPESDKYK